MKPTTRNMLFSVSTRRSTIVAPSKSPPTIRNQRLIIWLPERAVSSSASSTTTRYVSGLTRDPTRSLKLLRSIVTLVISTGLSFSVGGRGGRLSLLLGGGSWPPFGMPNGHPLPEALPGGTPADLAVPMSSVQVCVLGRVLVARVAVVSLVEPDMAGVTHRNVLTRILRVGQVLPHQSLLRISAPVVVGPLLSLPLTQHAQVVRSRSSNPPHPLVSVRIPGHDFT